MDGPGTSLPPCRSRPPCVTIHSPVAEHMSHNSPGDYKVSEGSALVEVIVNVPIRRSFRQQERPPQYDDFGGLDGDSPSDASPEICGPESTHQRSGGAAQFQTFHYHLPPHLIGEVKPGHLVWGPLRTTGSARHRRRKGGLLAGRDQSNRTLGAGRSLS